MSLEGKIALVTGASRGIGHGIALELGRCGAEVVGTATSAAGANALSDVFQEQGITGKGMVLDVRDADSIAEVLSQMKSERGVANILVNNAGITEDNIFLRMREEQWDAVIDTNLSALYRVTKPCVKLMLKSRWGRVINIASVVGVTGNPGQANYCAAKAGMIGFSKALALEFAAYGITVNTVAPGFINTDMTHSLNEEQQQQILSTIPMKKMGCVEDIASTVAFLASDQAAYITGQTLHVNGGMCMV